MDVIGVWATVGGWWVGAGWYASVGFSALDGEAGSHRNGIISPCGTPPWNGSCRCV